MILFSNPSEILKSIGLGVGSVVVDLGSGSGHYSMTAARMVGSEGKVYAVDVQKDLLERLRSAAVNEGHTNIEIIWGDIEQYGGTKLRDGTADVVLMANILFQLEDKRTALQEAKRLMRKNGRLLVVDWTDSHFGMGPDAQLVVTHDQAIELLTEHGFSVEKDFEAGDHHYGLLCRLSESR